MGIGNRTLLRKHMLDKTSAVQNKIIQEKLYRMIDSTCILRNYYKIWIAPVR